MLLLKTITDYEVANFLSSDEDFDEFFVNLSMEVIPQILHPYNVRRILVMKKRMFFYNVKKHYSQKEIRAIQGISQRELQYFSSLLRVFKRGLQKNKEVLNELSLTKEDIAKILYYCPMNHLYYYYNEKALAKYESDEVAVVLAIYMKPILEVSREYELFLNEKFNLGIEKKKPKPEDKYLLLLEELKKDLDEETKKMINNDII